MHAMTISNPPLLPPSTINSDTISSPKVQITSSSQLKLTMELQFQQQQCQYQAPATGAATTTTSKAASKGMARSKCKFVGVRQRPSGRWVAEIKDTTHKIRVWLGTFETAEEAARAYDEAACLLRGSNTRTNFATTTQHGASSSPAPQPDSPLVSRIRTLLTHKKLKKSATPPPPPPSPQQPTIAFTPTTTTHRRHASAIATTTSKVSASSSSSSTSSSISFSMSGSAGLSNQRVADEVYRAYHLINHGSEELRLTTQQFDHQPWAAALNDTIAPLAGGCDMANAGSPHCPTIAAELDAMKMENQEDSTSASPSGGMSGVVQEQDGFDIGSDPCDSLWDLPPICQLSCRSLMY